MSEYEIKFWNDNFFGIPVRFSKKEMPESKDYDKMPNYMIKQMKKNKYLNYTNNELETNININPEIYEKLKKFEEDTYSKPTSNGNGLYFDLTQGKLDIIKKKNPIFFRFMSKDEFRNFVINKYIYPNKEWTNQHVKNYIEKYSEEPRLIQKNSNAQITWSATTQKGMSIGPTLFSYAGNGMYLCMFKDVQNRFYKSLKNPGEKEWFALFRLYLNELLCVIKIGTKNNQMRNLLKSMNFYKKNINNIKNSNLEISGKRTIYNFLNEIADPFNFSINNNTKEVSGGGRYVYVKNYGKRKIRYFKNGKKYIILKGIKKSIK